MIKSHIQFIKSLREQRGFSQQEIADKLGISRTSYIAVEQGKKSYYYQRLKSFLVFLELA